MRFKSRPVSFSKTSLIFLVILSIGIFFSPVSASQLVYSSFLGGSGGATAKAIAIDQNGNAYITGYTSSPDFPVTALSFSTISSGGEDVFVSKIDTNSSGTASLVYSTFLGGSVYDAGLGIAIDGNGNAFITGYTYSTEFPVTANAFSTTYIGAGNSEAFVTQLNTDTSGTASLVYSSYLGGSGGDQGLGIAVDTSGNIYITGLTLSSTDFPVTSNAFSTTYIGEGNNEAFVAKMNPHLSSTASLVYSTYLGGNEGDGSEGIALDNNGNAYIIGYTMSANFPVTSNGFSTTKNGQGKVFLSEINTDSSGTASLVYSSFLGGSSREEGKGIAVDGSGNAYLTGYTWSVDFPVTANAFSTTNSGNGVAFVTKINTHSSGTSGLVYSTCLGGTGGDQANAIAIDLAGKAYVSGQTWSIDFPVTSNGLMTTYQGLIFLNAFYSKLNTNSSGSASLEYSTYLAGTQGDAGYGIAVDTTHNVYITGGTFSPDFPVTSNGLSTTYIGSWHGEGFITRFGIPQVPVEDWMLYSIDQRDTPYRHSIPFYNKEN